MWLLSQRGLRTANQSDKSTIFLRATTRSRMIIYIPEK